MREPNEVLALNLSWVMKKKEGKEEAVKLALDLTDRVKEKEGEG